MLGRLNRFHGYGSLKAVYQHGRNIRGALINLKVSQRRGNRPYRVAVVVSRKVSKSAVTRNRIRRRVYEAVRTSGVQVAPGTDLVFTAYGEQLASLEAAKLQAQVKELLQKATTNSH